MRRAWLLAAIALLALPGYADAAFPGLNGKIAFYSEANPAGIRAMNPDGSGQVWLHDGGGPVWSPDGQSLLFLKEDDLRKMPADGSSETVLLQAESFPPFYYCYYYSPDWSPDGTRIVTGFNEGCNEPDFPLYEMYVAAADGSGPTKLPVAGESPSWHPNGSEIAYIRAVHGSSNKGGVHAIHPDGTGHRVIWEPQDSNGDPMYYAAEVDYSPDGTNLVFSAYLPVNPVNGKEIFVVSASGGTAVQLTANAALDDSPVWSPDGTKIAFTSNRDGNYEIYRMNADGTNQARVTNDPAYQAGASWQPTWGSGYPRPKGATPVRVSLVPAHAQCASPNRTHGPPLAYGSCAPNAPESTQLTTGTPDLNGQATGMNGFVRYETILGIPSTPADEADIAVRVQITDVREQGTLADYAGNVQARAIARLTDRNGSGADPATTTNILFPLTTQCSPTADATVGATCSLTTTLDTLIPGAIAEGQRTVMQLSQVQVIDGGADGDTGTEPNTIFLRQGVLVP